MKIEATQEALLDLFTTLSRAAGDDKSLVPMYTFVKIEAYKDRALFFAANGETELIQSLPAQSELPGRATVPCQKVMALIKDLSKQKPVKLEMQEDGKVLLKQGRSRYTINSADPRDFPQIEYFKEEEYTPLPPESLLEGLNSVFYSVSKDEFRGALRGVLVEPAEEGFMRLVGCDGHRLSCCKVPGVITAPFLLTPKACTILRKILPKIKEMGCKVETNMVFFQIDRGVLNCRLLVNEYPDYRKIIPGGKYALLKFKREDIMNAVKRSSPFSVTGSLRIQVDMGKVIIKAHDQTADAQEEVLLLEGSQLDGALELGINGSYLHNALEHLKEDTVDVRIYGQTLPLVISEKNLTKIIMPRKL